MPSLAVTAIFAFVTSWDEPVVALFLSTSRPTLPVHIFNHIQTIITPTVAAVSTLLMIAVLAAAPLFLLVARRARRRAPMGRGGAMSDGRDELGRHRRKAGESGAPVGLNGPHRVLEGIDVNIPAGEFLTLLGASESGKTTLLRIIAGLVTPRTGRVLIDERDVTRLAPRSAILGLQ